MWRLRRRYLRGLAGLICRRPALFASLGLALAIVAGWHTVRHLDFKTSRGDLIGRDSEYWRLFSEYAEEFRAEEDFVIVVEGPEPARNRAALDAFVAALLAPANNPHPADHPAAQQFEPTDVYYHVDFQAMEPWFLYYLSTDELGQIRESLQEFKQLVAILQHAPTLARFFTSMGQMLDQMAGASAAQRRDMESFLPTITRIVQQMGRFEGGAGRDDWLSPWASAFFSEEMLAEAEREMQWQGYQVFLDGQMFIALVHPRAAAAGNMTSSAATIEKLRRIIGTVRAEFPELGIHLTGEPVLDHDEMAVSQQDATRATLLTLVVIAVLFSFSFRELLRPVLAVGAMVLVLVMSLGYATAAVGHLNLITVTFAVMILGLGIDLGIQLVARYEEELARGEGRQTAISNAIEHTGSSIITAGITNAAAFFAMGLSGFRGVTELGIIAGGGMLIATAVTILVLPALLLLFKRRNESTHIPAQAAATRIEETLLARPLLILGVCGVITLAALSIAWKVRFDYNVLSLQSRGLESVETELRLLNADVESTIFAAVVTDTFAETRRLHARLAALDTVSTVHSIAELIPEDQAAKVPLIAAIREQLGATRFEVALFDPADAEAALRSLTGLRLRAARLAREAGEGSSGVFTALVEAIETSVAALRAVDDSERAPRLAEYQRRFYADLETQLGLMANQSERPMQISDVAPELQRLLIGKSGKFLIRVFPNENIWNRDELVRFVHAVQSVAPKTTGTPLGLYEFVDILIRGYRNAALWALLVIVVLVFIDLRSLWATFFSVLPLLVGMTWMLGAMVVFDLAFNPANIIVLPLLVGIGVAYGIYVVQRFREDHSAQFYRKSTGRAVILSALTTIVAFSSLILGAHRGIRSLGMIMSIGVTACLIAALLLLPSLLELARRRGWKV